MDIGRGQIESEGTEILREPVDALGARDRDHVGALRQHPGEDELRRSAAFFVGNRLDGLHELAVLREILGCEAGMAPAGVARSQVGALKGLGQFGRSMRWIQPALRFMKMKIM